uniref:NAC domain-containing protein n=1 Tax=Oryza brachyantha TaxID=4533 RepID=J3LJ46_ORYBR
MMAGLRAIESRLLPGFRFHPSDEELVCYYLRNKQQQQTAAATMLVEVDLHACEPWELPEVAKMGADEWYFFSYRDRKYATGSRRNRATKQGYWKATGKDKAILHEEEDGRRAVAGARKTLVFYFGRAPNGRKSGWGMHEFRLLHLHPNPKNMQEEEDWVLCRVFHKQATGVVATTTPSSSSSAPATHHLQQLQVDNESSPLISSSPAAPVIISEQDQFMSIQLHEDDHHQQRIVCSSRNDEQQQLLDLSNSVLQAPAFLEFEQAPGAGMEIITEMESLQTTYCSVLQDANNYYSQLY